MDRRLCVSRTRAGTMHFWELFVRPRVLLRVCRRARPLAHCRGRLKSEQRSTIGLSMVKKYDKEKREKDNTTKKR